MYLENIEKTLDKIIIIETSLKLLKTDNPLSLHQIIEKIGINCSIVEYLKIYNLDEIFKDLTILEDNFIKITGIIII